MISLIFYPFVKSAIHIYIETALHTDKILPLYKNQRKFKCYFIVYQKVIIFE